MKAKPKIIIGAFRLLRDRLGETQDGMAKRLGLSLSGWQQWEYGKRRQKGLRGPELKAVLDLCPDEETRALFTAPGQQALSRATVIPSDIGHEAAAEGRRALSEIYRMMDRASRGDKMAEEFLAQLTDILRRYSSIGTLPDHPKSRKKSDLAKLFDEMTRGDI